MDREPRVFSKIVYSLALGALAMYVLDPDKGKRRRAIARDKARSLMLDTRDALGVTRRDVAHRVQGLRARARRLVSQQPAPDELQLIERVRARMGRLVSHPHAIQVGARGGRVTLSGPIIAREVEPLLAAVRNVWGVADIDDRLVAYERAENIPSLQGGSQPHPGRPAVLQEKWPPALRAATMLGGTLLTLRGRQRRSLVGWVLALAGIVLTVRAATNRSWNTLLDDTLGSSRRLPVLRDTAAASPRSPEAQARRSGGPSVYDLPASDVGSALH